MDGFHDTAAVKAAGLEWQAGTESVHWLGFKNGGNARGPLQLTAIRGAGLRATCRIGARPFVVTVWTGMAQPRMSSHSHAHSPVGCVHHSTMRDDR
jgi:hypothetical protein